MNTPAHMIFAAAAFARPHDRATTLASVIGAFLPDLSLYLMAGVALFVMGLSPHYVFDTLYFSDAWQAVFAIDNSFILWGMVLGFGWWTGRRILMIFTASGLMHLAFDFLLHNEDARQQFWPLSDWVFRSPVSYWDSRYYGNIVAPIEMVVTLLLCLVLIRRFQSLRSRAVIATGAALQVAPAFIWVLVFSGGA